MIRKHFLFAGQISDEPRLMEVLNPWVGKTSNNWTRIAAMNRSAGMLPAYSLPESRTINSDRSRLVDTQRFKPAASRRSIIGFIERHNVTALISQ